MTTRPYRNAAWLLMLPAALLMAVVGVVPLVAVFNYSLHDIFSLRDVLWVGAEWYGEIVTSPRFHASLLRSLMFSAVVLAVQVPLGVGIALVLRRTGRWAVLGLMLVALPLVVPWNLIGPMWLGLVNAETGLVGQALGALGIGFDWKFTALHTWILLVAMDTWHWIGLVVILSYAGLSGVAPEAYRAAAIDGASRLAVFRFIEVPRLAPALGIVLLLRFVDSFMIYTEAFAINAGGPDMATHFLAIDLGEEIKAFNYGSAAARSMVYFLIVITVIWAFARLRAAGGRE
ncbi:carbohydrate ABC transporter permease [Paragemmobacter straminiformis]|uniref:Sugar ABC transporter permease n=1 Tax=Paragemmobacter straminiformis TaxID=2045119 RepID=A0A842I3I3_9RHOB|nr:sugar ABC transporter permease [Gemmobacter straminiformis]MBC2834007.1 sugar ABC transporter permease [Gemmobacter straminiformis]